MSRSAQIPAVRFAGFIEEWEERKLLENATEINRNDPNSTAPIMMITANHGFIEQSERYAFNNAGESLKKYILLEKGELAYNHGASKLRPYGSCFALTTSENARIPFVYHCFDVGENDSEFVSIELNETYVENQLRKIVTSGARMDGLLNISYGEYSNVELRLPKIEEQEKIAAYFRNLDTLITQQQKKCEQLANVKKAMLEKMFPKKGSRVPEIRFAGFEGEWEEKKLGECATISKGTQLNKSVLFEYGSYYVLNGGMTPSGYTNSYNTEKDTISISEGGNSCGFVNYNIERFWSGGHNYTLSNIQIDCLYLYAFLKYKESSIMALRVGSGLPNIQKNRLIEVDILYPSLPEQTKIGKYFEKLDVLITLQRRKLDKLKNIKKSLLQRMFPGA